MKTNMTILIFMIVSLFFLPLQLCKASYFTMNLKQDSIYTPGQISLAMNINDETPFDSGYKFKISIFLTGTLIREQTINADRGKPVDFELSVPEVFERTEGRCRCELLIGDNFIEAQELPLLLWPEIAPYKKDTQLNAEIWVYDTSGKLLNLFKKMEIKVIDATFKTARDFGKPDIVFVGENTDPNNMRILDNSLIAANTEPAVIYLKQKQFLKENKIDVVIENKKSQTIIITRTNMLLTGLNYHDILTLANNANYIKIKQNSDMIIHSEINESIKNADNIYSYLLTQQENNQVRIYCQLPVTSIDDPRCVVLLKNILQYAESTINEIKAK
ncbi:MAG: hypothetical protein JXA96_05425 [Sedimentisphaerales bacterium]|nr:hypothetical protein [Sedimentisphaerales bacterium]